ncbi:Retrovirus-related Pol polyprotein from transposon opus [Nosema granulosis]|uniref:Retrovirus-related Pol polyprotein from transposon opus n=1 Tax=Nosema granulosis TaxID=83296 RepID=A0A9P6GXM7_9MICR|nr:Retrovirus-related Pol polyprotein from transposon opus [Nosema granulosis]
MPILGSRKKLQSFLGLVNYSSKHISHRYKFTKGLYDILKLKGNQEEKFWNNYMNEVEGIVKCKEIMESAATLYIPDLNKKIILTTDASTDEIGAILSQEVEGRERIVASTAQ